MILPFSTQLNKKETLFPERILSGLLKTCEKGGMYEKGGPVLIGMTPSFIHDYGEFAGYNNVDEILEVVDKIKPKLHTIRDDRKNRWKAGREIDFFINARKKNMFRFAPRIPVVSTQEIKFYWWKPENPNLYPNPFDDKINRRYCDLYVDGQVQMIETVQQLAINDGFESVDDFFAYFNEDFKGKIIHWTDLKY